MTLFSLLISFVKRELGCAVDSIRQPWLSFKDDFWFYSDSVFAVDFWISTGIVCLTIPCFKHESIFAIGFSCRSWILWRCRLHTSTASHITVAISGSKVTLFLLMISGHEWRRFHSRFHASTMTLFCLLISFVNRELICTVDSIHQRWLSFKDDFSFYSDSVFAVDFWISAGIVCLTIPCVKHESIFAIGFSCQSWILWRCRLHTSAATHITVAISGSKVTMFSLTFSGQ